MRKLLLMAMSLGVALAAAVTVWRRDPRIGSGFVNRSVNPLLLRRGLSGAGPSELGTIEHVGRRSGTRRLTPVHPVVVGDEVRIVVPLGTRSEWAKNVLAAGRCRIQLHDQVLDLDQPALVPARTMDDLPKVSRTVADGLGFMYLRLHMAGRRPGQLEPVSEAPRLPEREIDAAPGVVGEPPELVAAGV